MDYKQAYYSALAATVCQSDLQYPDFLAYLEGKEEHLTGDFEEDVDFLTEDYYNG